MRVLVARIGRLVEQTDADEILGCDRQRNRVADGLVESVVCAVAEQDGLVFVCAVLGIASAVVMVLSGARTVAYLAPLPLALPIAWLSGVVALRGQVKLW